MIYTERECRAATKYKEAVYKKVSHSNREQIYAFLCMFANMEEEVKSGWSNEPVEGAEELLAYLHKLQEQIPEEDLPKEALFFLPVGYSGTINDFIKMMEFDPKEN